MDDVLIKYIKYFRYNLLTFKTLIYRLQNLLYNKIRY